MNPSSIAEFSLQAAQRYIQSAVFIDDNIYNQASIDEVINVEVRQPKNVIQPVPEEQATHVEGATADENPVVEAKRPFRTKDFVGAFAKHGIVCALYEPEPDFPTDEKSTVFKLCQTADFVILDWDFGDVGVTGTKPKALIKELITSGNLVAPHHVRLIAIFTNTQTLQSIGNSIYQHLLAQGVSIETMEHSPLRLQAGATRILVLGKAGGVRRIEAEESFTVPENELANRMLQEFANMNQGILPSCALLGMAAVRSNFRRILDKFRADLDAQFLLHRALIRSSEEAFDQLPELLGDEFKAAIEDADFRPDNVDGFVAKSCDQIPVKPHSQPWNVDGKKCEDVLKEFLSRENFLSGLLRGKKAPETDGCQPKKTVESLALMCSVNDLQAHTRFASLLSGRTQYQVKHRDLGLGVILLDKAEKKYSVCIMPICDSLRLKGPTAFPFWELVKVGKGHPVVVESSDGRLLKLVFKVGKPSLYLWMAKFTPDSTRGIVCATIDGSNKAVFKSGTTEFEWVGQLKPSHAQRIANAVGQQLSRVGLTEAEWARITFGVDPILETEPIL